MAYVKQVASGALGHLPGYRVWLYRITEVDSMEEALRAGQTNHPCALSVEQRQNALQDGTGEFLCASYRIYGGAPKSGEYYYEVRAPERNPE